MVSIGVAGEKCVRLAAVINDRGRAAARSGLGAVMGSKNLKAVACFGFQRPGIFNKDKVKELVTSITDDMQKYSRAHAGRAVSTEGLPAP